MSTTSGVLIRQSFSTFSGTAWTQLCPTWTAVCPSSSFKLRQPNIYVMLPGMPVLIQRLPPQGKGGTMQEFRIVVSAFHKL